MQTERYRCIFSCGTWAAVIPNSFVDHCHGHCACYRDQAMRKRIGLWIRWRPSWSNAMRKISLVSVSAHSDLSYPLRQALSSGRALHHALHLSRLSRHWVCGQKEYRIGAKELVAATKQLTSVGGHWEPRLRALASSAGSVIAGSARAGTCMDVPVRSLYTHSYSAV